MKQTTNPIETIVAKPIGPAAISLVCMFQIVTACCIFFACLRISPLLAIIGTVVATPAIIRTGLASELYRKNGRRFNWTRRIRVFLESVGVVVLSLVFILTVFSLVSMSFGLICVVIAFFLGTAPELLSEIAFIGTFGGAVWGVTGAILAVGLCAQTWKPTLESNRSESASLDADKLTTAA
jgi:hypothetical protein